MGDGVNIASRLEGVAAPGGISYPRMPLARSKRGSPFPSADLGSAQLKNIADRSASIPGGVPPERRRRDVELTTSLPLPQPGKPSRSPSCHSPT